MGRGNPAEELRVFTSLLPVSRTTTTNGTGVDTRGFRDALVVIHAGTLPSSQTITAKVQESSDDGSSDAYADILGAAFTVITTANDNNIFVGRIQCEETERYIRPVLTVNNALAYIFSVEIILSNAKYPPVTQANSVAFDVPAIS